MSQAVNYGPDRDLARKRCSKRIQHQRFFKLRNFNHRLLPYPYKKNKKFNTLVQALGRLVVKINLKQKSSKRPPVIQSTSRGPSHSSGQIIFSELVTGTTSRYCPCDECQAKSRSRKSTEWAVISIKTAAHCIFNDEEVKNATCTLDYDVIGKNCITLKGYKLDQSHTSVDSDTSKFYCITHDLRLAKRLIGTIYQLKRTHGMIFKRYPRKRDKKFVIVVSHPHGCVKHVSFGKQESRNIIEHSDREARTYTRLQYAASTCPGSSGAPIYTITQEEIWYLHSHSSYAGNISESNVVWERYDG